MEIIYEDDSILVINKPSGLLSIQDGYDPMLPHVKTVLAPEYGPCWIVHRLDKETSGVLILARNKAVHRTLNTLFQNREVHKTYHAMIYGVPDAVEYTIDLPLKVNGDRQHRTVIDFENGKPAQTTIKILKTRSNFSIVSAQPKTGYTHQIRAHLSATGNPIVGDSLYPLDSSKTIAAATSLIHRVALHAFELAIPHPITKKLMTFSANYPEDFINLMVLFN